MKRKKIVLFTIIAMTGILTACSFSLKDDSFYIPQAASLPSDDNIDWNDLPESWTGNGEKVTDYYSGNYYEAVADKYPYTEEYSQSVDENGIECYISKDYMDGLKNLALQNEINNRLQVAYDDLTADTSFFNQKLTDEIKQGDIYNASSSISPSFTITGNVLSFSVMRYNTIYSYDNDTGPIFFGNSEIMKQFNYDMETGKELALSDIFINGTDLNALLNPMISDELSATPDGADWEYAPSEGIMRPFRGLPKNYPYFTLGEDSLIIYFTDGNPYITSSAAVRIPIEAISNFLAQPVSKSSDSIMGETTFRMCYRTTNLLEVDYSLKNIKAFGREDFSFQPYLLKNNFDDPVISKINNSLLDEYNEIANSECPISLPDSSDESINRYAYSYLETNKPFVHLGVTIAIGDISESIHRYFDSKTGEPISLDQIIINKEEAKQYLSENGINIGDLSTFYNFYTYLPGELYVGESNDLCVNYVPLSADIFNLERFK
ncbi:MAG: hypothetical protein VB078_10070 [Clostridiaceae bacterium]|nr:hypothetical protein [Clostridiaceae bacterium]